MIHLYCIYMFYVHFFGFQNSRKFKGCFCVWFHQVMVVSQGNEREKFNCKFCLTEGLFKLLLDAPPTFVKKPTHHSKRKGLSPYHHFSRASCQTSGCIWYTPETSTRFRPMSLGSNFRKNCWAPSIWRKFSVAMGCEKAAEKELVGDAQILPDTLSPRIMEVENGCVWKVTVLFKTSILNFHGLWLWEEGYFVFGKVIRHVCLFVCLFVFGVQHLAVLVQFGGWNCKP